MAFLFATACNPKAPGFFFSDWREYEEKAASLRIIFDIEKFEICYVEGADADLFSACQITEQTLRVWFGLEKLANAEKRLLYYLINRGCSLRDALMQIRHSSRLVSTSKTTMAESGSRTVHAMAWR